MAVAQTVAQLKKAHPDSFERDMVDLDILVEEEGFNVRDYDEPSTDAHIDRIKRAYAKGEFVPPIVIRVVDGTALIRDGHCRVRAAKRARDEGANILRLQFVEYTGDEVDQVRLLLTSNSGKPLNAIERARVLLRLENMGLSVAEIANQVEMSDQSVRQSIALIGMPRALQDHVISGAVTATLAGEIYQEHGGSGAVKVIEEAQAAKSKKLNSSLSGKSEGEEGDQAKQAVKITRKDITRQRRLAPAVLRNLRSTVSTIAPAISQIELKDDQSSVDLTLDRETFLQFQEVAAKVLASETANPEEDGEAEPSAPKKRGRPPKNKADKKKSKSSAKTKAAQAATPASAASQEKTSAPGKQVAASGSDSGASSVLESSPLLAALGGGNAPEQAASNEPSSEAATTSAPAAQPSEKPEAPTAASSVAQSSEKPEDSSASQAPSEEMDDDAMMADLASLTSDDFDDEVRVVRDEDEEHEGMHNTPENWG